jgi:hypothetical protein
MNEDERFHICDTKVLEAMREKGLSYTHSSCMIKGCYKIISSPNKLGMKLKEIQEKFPEAVIINIDVSFGYQYATIRLWEEEE